MVELPQVDGFRARLATHLEGYAEEMVDAISSAMFADLGPYQRLAGPGEVERLRIDIRRILAAVRRLVSGTDPFSAGELAELHVTGARRAQQGIPFDAVAESLEIAMRVTWRFVRDAAPILAPPGAGADGTEASHAAAVVADLALETRDFMNELEAAVLTGYRMERDHGDIGRALATADLVDEMLEGRGGTVRRVRQTGRALGHEISEPLVLVLLAALDPAVPPADETVSELVAAIPPALVGRVRTLPCPHIAVVLPRPDSIDRDWLQNTLTAAPIARQALVLVDPVPRSMAELPQAYRTLAAEIPAARVMANGAGVVSPRQTDLLRVLRELPLATRLDYVRGVLGPVLVLPPGKASEVLNTLHAYFRGRGRLDETAADLQLHRNSFRYRLDRAQAILGVSFRDGAERLKVEVALVLHELARQEAALLDLPPSPLPPTA